MSNYWLRFKAVLYCILGQARCVGCTAVSQYREHWSGTVENLPLFAAGLDAGGYFHQQGYTQLWQGSNNLIGLIDGLHVY